METCRHCGKRYNYVEWLPWRVNGLCSQACESGKKPKNFVYIKGQKYDEDFINGYQFSYSTKFIGDIYS